MGVASVGLTGQWRRLTVDSQFPVQVTVTKFRRKGCRAVHVISSFASVQCGSELVLELYPVIN